MALRRASLRIVLPLVLLLVAALGLRWWMANRYIESTDDAYVRADSSVLTPRVGGEVIAVHVTDNQTVHKGDLLVEIDPRDYAAHVANAKAAVEAASVAITSNNAQLKWHSQMIAQAQATLDAAQADEERLEKEWHRADQLVGEGVSTAQRRDNALAEVKSGKANVAKAEAALAAAQQQSVVQNTDGGRLQDQLDAQQAALKLAELDLESTKIVAPIDGAVGDLAARLGERIAPGERLLTLVPLSAVYVEANFKETQLTHMAAGQSVELKIDAFPGQTLKGRVDSLAPASGAEFSLLPPQNATGNFTKIVQRVPVKIALQLDDALRGRLRPGMSVVARVDTRTTANGGIEQASR
jgi:membrane fusion protein (multidrug efflux system)